ncbi:MAG TPA: cysteine desulfurase family protein [Candidatus Methylacidiphilales bacterium]|nr:cysteine desulfurase family protein [Candidatus Methylacidiphilales bacterium]
MNKRSVYLDHQATTPPLEEVFQAMLPYLREAYGSPSSLHRYGLQVREGIKEAREKIARMINAESEEDIILTSGGTEAANLAIKGFAEANHRKGNHFVVSATEHPSLLQSIEFLTKHGFEATHVPVDTIGRINPEDVRAAITDKTILVGVHLVNHDIGTIQPVKEIAKITAEKGIALYADALAAAGWMPIDVRNLGVQLLSFSPHRFYGPKGIGVLYRNRKARVTSHIHGGVQENGRRAGTENVPGIIGAGVAAEFAVRDLAKRVEHVSALQKRLYEGLWKNVEYIKLNGPEPGPLRICNQLNLSTEFIEGEGQLLLLDYQGIAVASGSSCVSKSLKVSHVLSAIKLDHALAQGNIIMSLGKDNTVEDVDYVVETFAKIVHKLRNMSPMWKEFEEGVIDSVIKPTGRGKSFTEHAADVSGRAAH